MDDRTGTRALSRRRLLTGVGMAMASTPLAHVVGCASGGGSSTSTADIGERDGGGVSLEGGAAARGSSSTWASGGTASMTRRYRDPFATGLGSTCTLLCSATAGPCHAATLIRRDISERQPGLPMRISFLVVDVACAPVYSAEIEIWHASPKGMYSGNDVPALCTLGDDEATAARFFRGKQNTERNGRADFDTVFPGWYPGRTVHVHFTVRLDAIEYVTSQLVFDDALVDDIVATQPIYRDRGRRDTTNRNDGIVPADKAAAYTFQAERQSDGAMLAWKALVVRSSTVDTTAPLCAIGGS